MIAYKKNHLSKNLIINKKANYYGFNLKNEPIIKIRSENQDGVQTLFLKGVLENDQSGLIQTVKTEEKMISLNEYIYSLNNHQKQLDDSEIKTPKTPGDKITITKKLDHTITSYIPDSQKDKQNFDQKMKFFLESFEESYRKGIKHKELFDKLVDYLKDYNEKKKKKERNCPPSNKRKEGGR